MVLALPPVPKRIDPHCSTLVWLSKLSALPLLFTRTEIQQFNVTTGMTQCRPIEYNIHFHHFSLHSRKHFVIKIAIFQLIHLLSHFNRFLSNNFSSLITQKLSRSWKLTWNWVRKHITNKQWYCNNFQGNLQNINHHMSSFYSFP